MRRPGSSRSRANPSRRCSPRCDDPHEDSCIMINGTRYRLTMEINRQSALSQSIARTQTEISTGKRIQAPSDDPVAAARISSIARTQANESAFKANLDLAYALAARADTALKSVNIALDRATELMVQ